MKKEKNKKNYPCDSGREQTKRVESPSPRNKKDKTKPDQRRRKNDQGKKVLIKTI